MSNTIYVGETASVSLGAHDSITVSSENATGTLTFTSNDNNLLGDFSASIQSKTYGPYGHPTAVVIRPTSGRVVYTHNLSSIDPTLSQVTRAGTGKFSPINAVQYVLAINDGEAIDTAINAWIAEVRARAVATGITTGIGHLQIPGGNYVMSSTTSTITLECWMSIETMGTVYVDCAGHSVPVFWIRNDVTPQLNQGFESDYSPRRVIDGGKGTLNLNFSNNPVGSCGIRFGNADGVWGSPAYSGDTGYHAVFSEVYGVHIQFAKAGIQLTNNNGFCSNWRNIWVSNTTVGVQTSAASGDVNTYEQHRFSECFFGNIYQNVLEFNSTGNRDHQLAFHHSSFTQCPDEMISIKTAAMCRVELTQMRIENFLLVAHSTVASPRSWIRMGANVCIIPNNTIGVAVGSERTTYLRKMFTGTYNLQIDSAGFNITGDPAFATQVPASSGIYAYGDAVNQFICDDTIVVMADKTYSDDPKGDETSNGNVRMQPIWNTDSAINFNSGFEEATLLGWTAGGTGTVARTTTATEFYTGVAGAQIDCAAQYANLKSDYVPVEPGGYYFGHLVSRCDPASTAGSGLFIICGISWYGRDWATPDAVRLIRSDYRLQSSAFQNWNNRKHATQWFIHPTGTGLMRAPAGAVLARVEFHFTGSAAIPPTAGALTTNCTAVWYIDNALLTRIS